MISKIASLYRQRLSLEKGTVKKDWGGRVPVALIYPNLYQVGMSNLGFQDVYGILNDIPGIVSERAFLPGEEELSIYKRTNCPLLSVETCTPVSKFRILAFSLSFENDYPNILEILKMSGTPLTREKREECHPLVIAGGITTFMNPEPLADFIDCFLLGEAEIVLKGFCRAFLDLPLDVIERHEIIKILAEKVEGLYCPSLYRVEYRDDGRIRSFEPALSSIPSRIKVAKKRPLQGKPARSRIITPSTEFSDTVLLELTRGCGHACRFCAAGYVYRPPRNFPLDEVIFCLEEILEKYKRVGLVSSSVSDFPETEKVTGFILDKGGGFSISSIRADAVTEDFAAYLQRAGQKTVTIAPETGSERLRRVINKGLTNEQIIRAVQILTQKAHFHIKLYFMIGLPTETREDVREMVELVKTIRHHIIKKSRGRSKIGRIRLSVNCFVPKPFTPFQWFPMDTVKSLKAKQRDLKSAVSKLGGVSISFDVPKWAYIQTLFSMGDRRVGRMLLDAHENNWDWNKVFRNSDLNPDFFVYRQRELDEILPWDFIDHGIRKSILQEEYRLSLASKESPACNVGACNRCGVCG